MAELNLMHEELLGQEDMTIRDLPIELQRQVRGFNVQKKKFDENPSDNEGNRLTRISVDLAHKIQNFIEQDDEEEDDDDEQEEEQEEIIKKQPVRNEIPSQKTKDTEQVREKTKPTTTGISFGNFVMEKKIKLECQENGGRIKITKLASIIGKEPDYPEQKVHTINLRKVFLSSDYRIV
jgi:archaellum component FlaD/FlaE